MITGYDLINEYYEDEKLYSTGDDDLDDLLEKAFCDGYEYAQKEFARQNYKDLNKEEQDQLRKYRKNLAKDLLEYREGANNTLNRRIENAEKKYEQRMKNMNNTNLGIINPNAYKFETEYGKKKEIEYAFKRRGWEYDDEINTIKRQAKKKERFIRENHESNKSQPKHNSSSNNTTTTNTDSAKPRFLDKVSDFAKRTWNGENGLGKFGNRTAIIGGTAALGTGAYLIHKHRKKKKKESEEDKKENKL